MSFMDPVLLTKANRELYEAMGNSRLPGTARLRNDGLKCPRWAQTDNPEAEDDALIQGCAEFDDGDGASACARPAVHSLTVLPLTPAVPGALVTRLRASRWGRHAQAKRKPSRGAAEEGLILSQAAPGAPARKQRKTTECSKCKAHGLPAAGHNARNKRKCPVLRSELGLPLLEGMAAPGAVARRPEQRTCTGERCRANLAPGARFCSACGTQVVQEAPAADAGAPAAGAGAGVGAGAGAGRV